LNLQKLKMQIHLFSPNEPGQTQQEETIMTTTALKIAQRAILAAAFVSTAAFAQPASHETITVTPKQENVWGARLDVPNQQQARATENVLGTQLYAPASQVSVARAPAAAPAPATQDRN
jgi:hypothetical protein